MARSIPTSIRNRLATSYLDEKMSSAKQRLLRLSIAHYRSQNVSEEAFHRWAAEDHCARAAGIHARHGVEAYGMVSSMPPGEAPPLGFAYVLLSATYDTPATWFYHVARC